jgi:hypothetical protein
MFMLSSIFVIVCGLFEWNLCRFFIIYLYMYCHWRSSYQEGWDPINLFKPHHISVPVSIQDLNFQRHISWCLFILGDKWVLIRGDRTRCWFSGIIDHHCLNFLLIRFVFTCQTV